MLWALPEGPLRPPSAPPMLPLCLHCPPASSSHPWGLSDQPTCSSRLTTDLLPSSSSSAPIWLCNLPGLPAAWPRWPSRSLTTPTHSRAAEWAQNADAGGRGGSRLLEQLTAKLGLGLRQPGTCQPGKQGRGRPSRMAVRWSRGAQVRKCREGERGGGGGS